MGDSNPINVGQPDNNGNTETVLTPEGVRTLRDGKAGLSVDTKAMQQATGVLGEFAQTLEKHLTDSTYRVRQVRIKVYNGPDFPEGGESMLVFKCRNLPEVVLDAVNTGRLTLKTAHATCAGPETMQIAVEPVPETE